MKVLETNIPIIFKDNNSGEYFDTDLKKGTRVLDKEQLDGLTVGFQFLDSEQHEWVIDRLDETGYVMAQFDDKDSPTSFGKFVSVYITHEKSYTERAYDIGSVVWDTLGMLSTPDYTNPEGQTLSEAASATSEQTIEFLVPMDSDDDRRFFYRDNILPTESFTRGDFKELNRLFPIVLTEDEVPQDPSSLKKKLSVRDITHPVHNVVKGVKRRVSKTFSRLLRFGVKGS